jgi:hypothetical protein
MDSEGKLKELSIHGDDYAIHYLAARHTYYILKVEGEYLSTFHLFDRITRRSVARVSGYENK